MTQPVWTASPSQWTNFFPFLGAVLLVVTSVPAAILTNAMVQSVNETGANISSTLPTAIAIVFLFAGFIYGFWHYLVIYCSEYVLVDGKLQVHKGVLNKSFDSLEIYRIKDLRVVRPLILRPLGLGHILIESSDRSTPKFWLRAVTNATEVGKLILADTESERVRKGVREFD